MGIKVIETKITIEPKEDGVFTGHEVVNITVSDAGSGVYLIQTVTNTMEYYLDGRHELHSLFNGDGVYSHTCALAVFIEKHPELKVVSHSITTVDTITFLVVITEPR